MAVRVNHRYFEGFAISFVSVNILQVVIIIMVHRLIVTAGKISDLYISVNETLG